jgi:hypothetical protein
MRYLLFLIVWLMLLPSTSFAQDDVDAEWDSDPLIVVSPTKLNYIYRGVDNPIDVAVPGVSCEEITVNISHGRLEGKGCVYTVNVRDHTVNELQVIASWIKGGEHLTAAIKFRVKDLPLPNTCFAGSCTDLDTIPVASLKAAQGVVASFAHFGISLRNQVVNYRLRILRECSAVFDGVSNEARLIPEMMIALQGINSGDEVMITEVRAQDPTGTVKELAPLRLIVD